jgi:anthranilate phosphoribosyltransferase
MLTHATPFEVPGPAVDVVGTGGDLKHTVNISTMAALTVAGVGVRVVKHGNRAATSACGTADVLEALGLPLDIPPQRVAELAGEVGITFCFAPVFHPSMRHARSVRTELGIPTAFNILGPLTNPARVRALAVGCPAVRLAPLMAGVLAARGASGMVFRGHGGLDELAPIGPADVWWVRDGAVESVVIDPVADLGMSPVAVEDLRGGDPARNAGVVRRFLAGDGGPVRETVLLNAAAGLVAEGSSRGVAEGTLAERLRAGVELAADAVDDGRVSALLDRWIAAAQNA